MNMQTFLKLGRVSNLPTVWTNALAGAVLSGHTGLLVIVGLAIILSLFYVGGMWLNDAFDAEIDGRERANRPIPNGEISTKAVFAGGFAFLTAGVVLAFAFGVAAGLAGICLAVVIVLYDWLHKNTVLSPVIMGGARFFCYVVAGLAIGALTGSLVFGAIGLLMYTAGLTYAAKQEAFDRIDRMWPLGILAIPLLYALVQASDNTLALIIWAGLVVVVSAALRLLIRRNKGDVPKAVVTLIAGISLYDAALIAGSGQVLYALIAVVGFLATLALQRVVTGT